ncbi:GNAT family N-acetyltransferase [Streptomyces sp. NPDC056704]|uniref:GNAT family N-acetyltransferase n=1 Tax=Streptomyces sp. NPDC056704 TaxID=3345917 RepID=UPI003691448B
MNHPSITVLRHADAQVAEDVNRLISQLGKESPPHTVAHLERLIASEASTVLTARAGTRIIGMLTLVLTILPTGVVARLEDVVVDDAHRGRGIGPALVRAALDEATRHGAHQVDLTSRPSRVSAHRLYEKTGFIRRQTHVFRYRIDS